MLPPQLDRIRRSLEGKSNRTPNEDQLLEELRILDRDPNLQTILSQKSFGQIVSGPGTCSCCGR